MIQGLISRTRDVLEQEQTPDGGQPPRGEVEEQTPTALFHCERCDSVYICETMESCPECTDAVEAVPDEKDLGLL